MSARTKIVVLRLKELIYTGIFIALAILFIVLLVIIFKPKEAKSKKEEASLYTPGKYTTSIVFNDTSLDVEVTVSAEEITSVRLNNLDETVSVMYPLMEPALMNSLHRLLKHSLLKTLLIRMTTSTPQWYC